MNRKYLPDRATTSRQRGKVFFFNSQIKKKRKRMCLVTQVNFLAKRLSFAFFYLRHLGIVSDRSRNPGYEIDDAIDRACHFAFHMWTSK